MRGGSHGLTSSLWSAETSRRASLRPRGNPSPLTIARPRAALSPSRPNRCSPYQFGAPGGCARRAKIACAFSTAPSDAQLEAIAADVTGAELVRMARDLDDRDVLEHERLDRFGLGRRRQRQPLA